MVRFGQPLVLKTNKPSSWTSAKTGHSLHLSAKKIDPKEKQNKQLPITTSRKYVRHQSYLVLQITRLHAENVRQDDCF